MTVVDLEAHMTRDTAAQAVRCIDELGPTCGVAAFVIVFGVPPVAIALLTFVVMPASVALKYFGYDWLFNVAALAVNRPNLAERHAAVMDIGRLLLFIYAIVATIAAIIIVGSAIRDRLERYAESRPRDE